MALTSVETFYQPEDKHRVTELLQEHEDSAMIIAGGTFLHGLISRGLLYGIEALIDIQKLDLDFVESQTDGIEIGATTRFSQLQKADILKNNPWLGAISDALEYPPMQVMNSATIGGCVASSCPFFDLPTSFLALKAVVKVYGSEGDREIHLCDFFSGLFENVLNNDEFIVALKLPKAEEPCASAFIKLETNANDLAILNVAACLQMDAKENCQQASIYVGGGIGESPVKAPSAEAVLQGKRLNEELINEAAEAAKKDVDPLSDHRASAEYRKAMTGVLVKRTLVRALKRLT